jgi:hypothetical protein
MASPPDLHKIAGKQPGGHLRYNPCVFAADTGELQAAFAGVERSNKLALAPDGNLLYVEQGAKAYHSHFSTTLLVCAVPGNRVLHRLAVNDWWVSRDGRVLVVLKSDAEILHEEQQSGSWPLTLWHTTVRIYDTATWHNIAAYRVYRATPIAVALSPDASQLVFGCSDGAVRVWDRTTEREVAAFRDLCTIDAEVSVYQAPDALPPAQRKPLTHLVAFSPDGQRLAAANAYRGVEDRWRRVAWWSWPTGQLRHSKLTNHYHDPTDLQFSPDGQHLFCGHLHAA